MSGKCFGFSVHDNQERSVMHFFMSELLRLHFAVVGRWVTCTYKNFHDGTKPVKALCFCIKCFGAVFVIMSYDVIRMTNFGRRRHLKVLLCIKYIFFLTQAFSKFHCVIGFFC